MHESQSHSTLRVTSHHSSASGALSLYCAPDGHYLRNLVVRSLSAIS